MNNAVPETPRGLAITVSDGDQVRIGPDIVVTFKRRHGNKLVISAPRDLEIKRARQRPDQPRSEAL